MLHTTALLVPQGSYASDTYREEDQLFNPKVQRDRLDSIVSQLSDDSLLNTEAGRVIDTWFEPMERMQLHRRQKKLSYRVSNLMSYLPNSFLYVEQRKAKHHKKCVSRLEKELLKGASFEQIQKQANTYASQIVAKFPDRLDHDTQKSREVESLLAALARRKKVQKYGRGLLKTVQKKGMTTALKDICCLAEIAKSKHRATQYAKRLNFSSSRRFKTLIEALGKESTQVRVALQREDKFQKSAFKLYKKVMARGLVDTQEGLIKREEDLKRLSRMGVETSRQEGDLKSRKEKRKMCGIKGVFTLENVQYMRTLLDDVEATKPRKRTFSLGSSFKAIKMPSFFHRFHRKEKLTSVESKSPQLVASTAPEVLLDSARGLQPIGLRYRGTDLPKESIPAADLHTSKGPLEGKKNQ